MDNPKNRPPGRSRLEPHPPGPKPTHKPARKPASPSTGRASPTPAKARFSAAQPPIFVIFALRGSFLDAFFFLSWISRNFAALIELLC